MVINVQKNSKENLSLLLSFLGCAIFGFSFLFSKQALVVATPFVLLAVRFFVAFGILNVLLLTGKFKINLKEKNIKSLLLLGLLQPIIYFICENFGVKFLATSFVGIIISLVPVTSLIFGTIFLKEKATSTQVIFIFLSVAGVFLTTLGQGSGNFSWIGFILLLGAVCSTSMFNVLSRKLSSEFSAFERTYIMFALGCITFVGIALVESMGNFQQLIVTPLMNTNFWISIFYLSALSSVGAFFMLNYAMTYLEVARTSIFANVTTIISILAGVIFLQESFGIFQLIGSVIILASVYGVNKKAKPAIPESASYG